MAKVKKTHVFTFAAYDEAEEFMAELEDTCGSLVDVRQNAQQVIAEGNEEILADWAKDTRVKKHYTMEAFNV